MIDNRLAGLLLRQPFLVPRHKLAVVLDLRRDADLAPVVRDRAHTVRTDGYDLLHLRRLKGLQPALGKRLEDEVIAQSPRRIACTFFLFEHAEAGAEIAHHPREVRDNLPSLGIVAAHAA